MLGLEWSAHVVLGNSIDFKAANASKLESLNDLEVLAIAAEEGRILLSHDRAFDASLLW